MILKLLKRWDYNKARKLLWKEWNLWAKESWTPKYLCAWIYMLEILEDSDRIICCKENWKLIWFAGYFKHNSKKHILRKRISSMIKNLLYKSKKIKNLKALKEYKDNYPYTPTELENYFDWDATILIVDKAFRWKWIWKALFLKIFELAKKDGIKNLQILTDPSCSFEFYEWLGCKKVYEKKIKNEEKGRLKDVEYTQGFIYEKVL